MKAFVMKDIGKVGFMEKPIPEPGPDDAIIKSTAALVCTSDVHTVGGSLGVFVDRTLGHESVGTIYKLGSAVKGLEIGQRVAINAITPCFKCDNCLNGYTSQCQGLMGGYKFTFQKDGTFAEYFHVNDAEANVVPIPDSISDDAALYTTDMMSTGFMGAEHANIPLGGTVAIFGQGSVGLMATAGAKLLGAGLIIAVESIPNRQEMAKRFGADVIVDYTKVDPVEEILRLTNGIGVDSAIEALGLQVTFENCIKATKPGATISNVGYHSGEFRQIPNPAWGLGMSEKTIRTGLCTGGKVRMQRLLRLIETGKIDPTPMTTHRFKFEEADKALNLMKSKEDNVIKPMLIF